MKPLSFALTAFATTFVIMPTFASVGNGPYTGDAKAPPAGTGPRYAIKLAEAHTLAWLIRSEEAPPEITLPNSKYPPLESIRL